jgi:hypothetical protein
MKKLILTSAVVLMAAAALSYAQDMQLTGKADLTFTSRYVWRGFEVFGSDSAIHPSIDLMNPTSGIGFNASGHIANGGGNVENERWDFSPYYMGKLLEKDLWEINYRLAYVYYNYPHRSSHNSNSAVDLQELNAVLSFPNLTQVEGLVPSYVLVKLWPNGSDTFVGAKSPSGGTASGFAHIFMLDYAMPYVCPITGLDRKLNLHSEIVFNDGVAPNGANVDHDWSNIVIGASTDYEIEQNFFLTPGIFHQITLDRSVNGNRDNYTWLSLGASYRF